jgi:hypothetical protein
MVNIDYKGQVAETLVPMSADTSVVEPEDRADSHDRRFGWSYRANRATGPARTSLRLGASLAR